MTAADRQRGLRERQKALGRVRVSLWLDQADLTLLDDLCTRLGAERTIVIEQALKSLQRQLQPQSAQAQPHRRRRQAFRMQHPIDSSLDPSQ